MYSWQEQAAQRVAAGRSVKATSIYEHPCPLCGGLLYRAKVDLKVRGKGEFSKAFSNFFLVCTNWKMSECDFCVEDEEYIRFQLLSFVAPRLAGLGCQLGHRGQMIADEIAGDCLNVVCVHKSLLWEVATDGTQKPVDAKWSSKGDCTCGGSIPWRSLEGQEKKDIRAALNRYRGLPVLGAYRDSSLEDNKVTASGTRDGPGGGKRVGKQRSPRAATGHPYQWSAYHVLAAIQGLSTNGYVGDALAQYQQGEWLAITEGQIKAYLARNIRVPELTEAAVRAVCRKQWRVGRLERYRVRTISGRESDAYGLTVVGKQWLEYAEKHVVGTWRGPRYQRTVRNVKKAAGAE